MRKLMTMYKTLHLKDDVDKLFITSKGEWELANNKECVDGRTQRLEEHINKSKERLITAVNNSKIKKYKDG